MRRDDLVGEFFWQAVNCVEEEVPQLAGTRFDSEVRRREKKEIDPRTDTHLTY